MTFAGIDSAALLKAAFATAVNVARPSLCIPMNLPLPPRGRTVVIGAGKAAAEMALAVENAWDGPLTGLVVVPAGYAATCRRIDVIEAAHPVPMAAGEHAARAVLQSVYGLSPDDLVICLISGGGSALLPLPADGLELAEKQEITRHLLRCGATISEINTVRRHLSAIKGGRLGVACHPARLVTLAISDVPGDEPSDIASGPTVPDKTTCADAARIIINRYAVPVSLFLRTCLAHEIWESIKPGDPRLDQAEFKVIATPQQSLEAAANVVRSFGVKSPILSDRIEGEAREAGRVMSGIAQQVIRHGQAIAAPCVLLSGGETTVTVRGNGRGGRNVEFLLAFGLATGECVGISALAADTEGIDGLEPVAGAIWRTDTLARAAALGLDPRRFLDANDAHSFFALLGDSVITGPTQTNVNDFRAVLVLPM